MPALVEYQVKQLLAAEGVAVPEGLLVRLGSPAPVVPWKRAAVKAQTAISSRAKKGLVKICGARPATLSSALHAVSKAAAGLGGVSHALVEEALEHRREYYLAVVSDPTSRGPCLLFSRDGGVDVESDRGRGRVARLPLPVLKQPSDAALKRFFKRQGLSRAEAGRLASTAAAVYRLYHTWHCRMIEVNPLAPCGDRLVALDGKARLDEDALPVVGPLLREAGLTVLEDSGTELERAAARIDAGDYRGSAHFVQNDPALARKRLGAKFRAFVGFNGIGTGASLTAMDELVRLGFFPRNFCDTSGNPPASKLYRATRIILAQPDLRGYFFISCVSSQQLHHTARGILKAFKESFAKTAGVPPYPAVLVFRGAWDEEALGLLREHGLGASPHVALLGRDTTEREAAARFAALYGDFHGKSKPRSR